MTVDFGLWTWVFEDSGFACVLQRPKAKGRPLAKLDCSSSGQQVDDKNHGSDNEKQMDQSAADVPDYAK